MDSSPLIFLGKVGQLGLLAQLIETLVIPRSVAREVGEGPPLDPARVWLETAGESLVHPDAPTYAPIVNWDLGQGETAALEWAFHHGGCEAVLDDKAGRRCAAVFGLPSRETLSVLLAARQRNLIPAVKPVFEDLLDCGFFIEERLLRTALASVGETA